MRPVAVLLLLAALLCSGCGTWRAVATGDLTPFGGTAYCADVVVHGFWFEPPFAIIDMPWSFAADVALLPVTALLVPWYDNNFRDDPK